MLLRPPANRTCSATVYPTPADLKSRVEFWALAYVAVVVSIVFATIALFAIRSDAFASQNTVSSQTVSSPAPAHNPRRAGTARTLRVAGYELQISALPRHLGQATVMSIRLLHGAHTVVGARVRLTFSMPAMPDMRRLTTRLRQTAPGVYANPAPILTVGRWQARLQITPPHSAGFTASFNHRVNV